MKRVIGVCLAVAFCFGASMAMAEQADNAITAKPEATVTAVEAHRVVGSSTRVYTDTDLGVAMFAGPVVLPARLLSVPWDALGYGYEGASRIKNEAGRAAVQVAMAPLLLPAAILHLPSALLSPIGLTHGY